MNGISVHLIQAAQTGDTEAMNQIMPYFRGCIEH